MTSFNDLGLAEPLLRALDQEGYREPTPIQRQAIPPVLEGRDLLGIAQTGTGKTAAFALPILHRLAADKRAPARRGCRALILSPTRELATQIGDSFRAYGRHTGLRVAVVFGGVAHRPQIEATRNGVDVLVATPGRLLDHIGERNLDIAGTEILVLDEADQMLDLGFVKPIRRIVSFLSQRRQSLFFSATMPSEIGKLADELLNDPVKVAVTPVASTVDRVSQRVIHVPASQKRTVLVELLSDAAMSRTLIFTRTKRGADRVARHLETAQITAAAIHGNKSQRQREDALAAFKSGDTRVLVATDIAARGIDIDNVTHVINYELPDVPESYVHRIGRTARAGAEGDAISLCDSEERTQLRDIERLTRQTIPSEARGGSDPAGDREAAAERTRRGGRSGSRRDDRSGERREPRGGERRHSRSSGHERRPRAEGDREPRSFEHTARAPHGDGQRGEHRPRRDERSERTHATQSEGHHEAERRDGGRSGERRHRDGDRGYRSAARSEPRGDRRPERRDEPRYERRTEAQGESRAKRPHGDRDARHQSRERTFTEVYGEGTNRRDGRGGDRPRPQRGERSQKAGERSEGAGWPHSDASVRPGRPDSRNGQPRKDHVRKERGEGERGGERPYGARGPRKDGPRRESRGDAPRQRTEGHRGRPEHARGEHRGPRGGERRQGGNREERGRSERV